MQTETDGWHCLKTLFYPNKTCAAFDRTTELIWLGDQFGRVESLFASSPDLNRYTAYRAHLKGLTREIIADDKAIYSVGADSVKAANRRGLTAWNTLAEQHFYSSICTANARATDVIAGCAGINGMPTSSDLISISAATGTVLRRSDNNGSVIHLARTAHGVVSGTASGQIQLRDPRSLAVESMSHAHLGGLTALKGDGNLLLSLGYTLMQGRPIPEPLVKVWDVRTLRPLMPVNVPGGPAFVDVHPRFPSTMIVATQNGQVQIVDMNNPAKMEYHQVETSAYLSMMAVGPTGEGLLFGDTEGFLHLWANSNDPHYSRASDDIIMPDEDRHLTNKHIAWDDHTPLSVIGLPHYTNPLLSVIPYEDWITPYTPLFSAQPAIDPAVLSAMRMVDYVGYANNPNKSKPRNLAVLSTTRKSRDNRKMDVPLFRSQKEKLSEAAGLNPSLASHADRQVEPSDTDNSASNSVPKHFRRVEIQYSKFGVEDFDFGHYNKTAHSGLETHIANSYTNALLQLLNAIEPFSKVAQAHICQNCAVEHCLLCESGFLFKMLKDAKGSNCQASNFSRAFSAKPHAAALGLMDDEDAPNTTRSAYSTLIQTFHQFLLDQMSVEAGAVPRLDILLNHSPNSPASSVIGQLFGMHLVSTTVCPTCKHRTTRDGAKTILELVYPRRPPAGGSTSASIDFLSVLQASAVRENSYRSQCANCKNSVFLRSFRRLTHGSERDLPCVLAINAGVKSAEQLEMWQDRQSGGNTFNRFLPTAFKARPHSSGVEYGNCSLDSLAALKEGEIAYALRGLVVQIQSEEDGAHLVALVKKSGCKDNSPDWLLFNDFLVQEITETEALAFRGSWKIPAILYYERVDTDAILKLSGLPTTIDHSILLEDTCIAKHRDSAMIRHANVGISELPKKGTMISIDAEFVSLQQEEVEVHSDGTRRVIRPSRMSLARVSVLRGEGPQTGVPFIDDYIHTTDRVADYLTEFSGIRAGDLDAHTTKHTLVPLKVAYKKLRLLVDLQCVFVGHGLNKDFRIINIFVPPSQIIDTVNIYHLPARHRKLSLRFLAYVVLHSDIQSSGTHDSIEDARTALQLYEEYQRLDVTDMWDEELDAIYREGKRLGFKVPGSGISPMPPVVKLP